MYVYLVVEIDLQSYIRRNVAIFTTRHDAEKFIKKAEDSTCFEYEITTFLLNDYDRYKYKDIEN